MVNDSIPYESFEQAVDATILMSGKTYDEVACHVFPRKKPRSAYAHLKGCLNPDRPEKLEFEDTIHICRFCGRYDPFVYAANELGLKVPEVQSPELEISELDRQKLAAEKRLKEIAARKSQLLQKSKTRGASSK